METKIRVIHFSASDSGGAFVFAENLVNHIDKQHFEAHHLVYTGQKESFRYTSFRLLDHLIKFSLHATEKLYQSFFEKNKSSRFKFSLGFPGIPLFVLKRIVKNYDIIHLHWINKGFINISHLSKLNKPIVWTCHDIWPVTGGCHLSLGCENFKTGCGCCPYLKHPAKGDLSKIIHQSKYKQFLNSEIHLISPGKWMHDNIQNSTIGRFNNNRTITNGVNTDTFKNIQIKKDKNTFNIGFVAANLNDSNKALYRLIEALKLFPVETSKNFRLTLLGNFKNETEFVFPIKTNVLQNISDSVKISEFYNQLDLLICTSTIETFPTTLIESFCCGTIGIGFNVGGVSEITETMGITPIPAFNINMLSSAILEIYKNPYNRKEVSDKAKAIFGIDISARKYETLYREIMEKPKHY